MSLLLGGGAIITYIPTQAVHAQEQKATYSTYIPLVPLPYTTYSARSGTKLGEETPCNPLSSSGASDACKTDFLWYLRGIFVLLIAVSAVLAVVYIAYGGIEYVFSASELSKSNGKDTIRRALEGLVAVLCSYLIVYTINPNLVKLQFSASKISPVAGGSTSIFLSDPVTAAGVDRDLLQFSKDRAALAEKKAALENKIADYNAFTPAEEIGSEADIKKRAEFEAERAALKSQDDALFVKRADIFDTQTQLYSKQLKANLAEGGSSSVDDARAFLVNYEEQYIQAHKGLDAVSPEVAARIKAEKDATVAAIKKAIDCREANPTNTKYRDAAGRAPGPIPAGSYLAGNPSYETYNPYQECLNN